MFLINLFPYFARNNPVSYSWIGALAAKKLGLANIVLIGSKTQLAPPSLQRHNAWISDEVHLITDQEWSLIHKIEVPAEILEELYDEAQDGLNFLREISTSLFSNYIYFLSKAIKSIQEDNHLSAGFSLANDKSFEASCSSLGIPVIFSEGGPIRRPDFPFGTYFFDFKGINGAHSFDPIYTKAIKELDKSNFLEPELIKTVLYSNRRSFENEQENYELGVALQVEDDTNLISYSEGFSSLQALFKALWVFPRELILIRQHPLSKFQLRNDEFGVIDNSSSAYSFLIKCKRLLTINSSVAFESILLGKETYVLGLSPLNMYAESNVNRRLVFNHKSQEERRNFINIFFFVYLTPEWFWLDKHYYDFRLSNPSTQDIFDCHMSSYLSKGFFTLAK